MAPAPRSPGSLLTRPLPAPPAALRRGPWRERSLAGRHPDSRAAALLGIALGVALGVCLLTGLISHVHQHPPGWLEIPARPAWAYQLTQGLHVATGIATVPLVLAKLATVYPRLFTWPPARDLAHAAERLLLVPLVAGTLAQLATGLLNTVQWYPWHFFFPRVHWALAWVVAGSALLHVAIKAPVVRAATGRRRGRPVGPPTAGTGTPIATGTGTGTETATGTEARAGEPDGAAADRRTLLLGVVAAAGAVTLATVGQTVRPLRAVSSLASRDPAVGPNGLPVNRTAGAARVRAAALDPGWALEVAGPRTIRLTLADLGELAQHRVRLPIACVEGWSATATWSGVRLRDVLDLAGIPVGAQLRAVSLEESTLPEHWLYASSPVGPALARDPLTLLATGVNGAPLDLEHGFPLRLIGPNRPGVQQTKWLARIEEA